MKPTLYAFSELQRATRDFHADMKLGEGGFGTVYKVFQIPLVIHYYNCNENSKPCQCSPRNKCVK